MCVVRCAFPKASTGKKEENQVFPSYETDEVEIKCGSVPSCVQMPSPGSAYQKDVTCFSLSCATFGLYFAFELSDIMYEMSPWCSQLSLMHLRISCWLRLHFPVLFVLYMPVLLQCRVISGRTRHHLRRMAFVAVICEDWYDCSLGLITCFKARQDSMWVNVALGYSCPFPTLVPALCSQSCTNCIPICSALWTWIWLLSRVGLQWLSTEPVPTSYPFLLCKLAE